jgi:hypothetical protein
MILVRKTLVHSPLTGFISSVSKINSKNEKPNLKESMFA